MSPIVQFLLAMAPYIVPLLIAVLTYVVKAGIERLPSNSRSLIKEIVSSSVAAAEQMASDSLNGAGKKQIAVELIEKELAFFHINVDPKIISSLVEEAVLALGLDKSASSAPVASALPKVDTKGN